MKRPFNPTANYIAETGDIEQDFTTDQLAAIGKVAMAYNVTEEGVYVLFGAATGLQNQMLAEVFTRIGGMDGVRAIIQHGVSLSGLDARDVAIISELCADGGLIATYKAYRDAVIHARSLNALSGIGIRRERRARLQEVLMTADALGRLARNLMALGPELADATALVEMSQQLKSMNPFGPDRAQFAEEVLAMSAQFRAHRTRRLALPPLPTFPAEPELILSRDAWLKWRGVPEEWT